MHLLSKITISIFLLAFTSCSSSKKAESKKIVEDSITAPLETKSDKISDCYRYASSSNKKPIEGTIVLQWVIDGLGKAKNIASKKNTTKSDELADCIAKTIKEVSFPKELATRTIQYPFNFTAKKKD